MIDPTTPRTWLTRGAIESLISGRQLSGERDRFFPGCHLAGVDGGFDLPEKPAEPRAALEIELPGELVATDRRAWRPAATPIDGGAEHLPREPQVGLYHLGAGDRALAASRQPVSDAEQRHVHRHVAGLAQVDVGAAP